MKTGRMMHKPFSLALLEGSCAVPLPQLQWLHIMHQNRINKKPGCFVSQTAVHR